MCVDDMCVYLCALPNTEHNHIQNVFRLISLRLIVIQMRCEPRIHTQYTIHHATRFDVNDEPLQRRLVETKRKNAEDRTKKKEMCDIGIFCGFAENIFYWTSSLRLCDY